jgi:hypothetical protein
MPKPLRIALIVLAVLLGPLLLVIVIAAVDVFIIGRDCSRVVDREMAIETIETSLRKPSASAVLRGAQPKVVEIEEIGNFAATKEPGERAYKFRLAGAQGRNWALARVNTCGGLEIAGDLSGAS